MARTLQQRLADAELKAAKLRHDFKVAARKLDNRRKIVIAGALLARKAELETLRESWERIGNRHLERHGFEPTLDHRTLEAQGIERDPTIHLGKTATAIERKGLEPSELGGVNREIKADNERRVIDLATERAMREVRAEKSQDRSAPPEVLEKYAREAVQTPEAAAAPSAPGQSTTRTTGPESGLRDAGNVVTRILGGVSRMAEKFFDFLGDMIAPAPPPTRDQAERAEAQHWLVEEARRQAAHERESADRARAATAAELYGTPQAARAGARQRSRSRIRAGAIAPSPSGTRRGTAGTGRRPEKLACNSAMPGKSWRSTVTTTRSRSRKNAARMVTASFKSWWRNSRGICLSTNSERRRRRDCGMCV